MTQTKQRPAVPAVITIIEKAAPQFEQTLPAQISTDRFVRTLKHAVQRTKGLSECTPRSIVEAATQAAADGLMLDGREAALIVLNDTKTRTKVATYVSMFAGLLKRARNSGEISTITAHTVHTKDKFNYVLGDREELVHEPNWEDRGAIVGAYAIAVFKDGGVQRAFMAKAAIDAVRAKSRGKDQAPWKEHYEEMAKKTVIRRLAKMLPAASDLANVFAVEDDPEAEAYDLDAEFTEAPDEPAKPARAAAAVDRAIADNTDQPQEGDMI